MSHMLLHSLPNVIELKALKTAHGIKVRGTK